MCCGGSQPEISGPMLDLQSEAKMDQLKLQYLAAAKQQQMVQIKAAAAQEKNQKQQAKTADWLQQRQAMATRQTNELAAQQQLHAQQLLAAPPAQQAQLLQTHITNRQQLQQQHKAQKELLDRNLLCPEEFTPLHPLAPIAPNLVNPCPGNLTVDSPPYEPNRWNDDPEVLMTTNCYAYACNDHSGHPPLKLNSFGKLKPTKPQPGQLTGFQAQGSDCQNIRQAVASDSAQNGMLWVDPQPQNDDLPAPLAGYYLVALVATDPAQQGSQDYHWYRLDDNGFWSHKPGSYPVTNLDAKGCKITNPKTCNRDGSPDGPNYSKFCGYYYVPKAGAPTGRRV